MVKCSLIFLFVFLVLSSFSFAKNDRILAAIQSEYGRDLTHAPFFIRFAFQKTYGIDWKKSYYPERLAFLTDYETNLLKEQAQEKAEAKAEADQERAYLFGKRQDLRDERAKLRAKLAEEKAERMDGENRQKALNDLVKQQEKELQQMERLATQGND